MVRVRPVRTPWLSGPPAMQRGNAFVFAEACALSGTG